MCVPIRTMITYKLFSIYYATLQIGAGLERKSFHAHGDTRDMAIMLAIAKAERAGLIK
jgi:hypothetical protein